MKPLLAFVFASVAFGSTIPVTGLGTFTLDNFTFESTANLRFSGSSDAGSVSFGVNGLIIGPAPPSLLTVSHRLDDPHFSGGATIDGIDSLSWAISIGLGPGYLELLDASGNVTKEQDITGYIYTTDYRETGPRLNSNGGPNSGWEASGSFVIIPTPEAESGLLVGVGFAALLLGRKTAPRQS